MIEESLIQTLRAHFALDWQGIHGAGHWSRVRENGRVLSVETGARFDVVELFAFLHDSCRLSDATDPEHGTRAAGFARVLHARGMIALETAGLELLAEACEGHSEGRTSGDATVMTCWDADRLDLGRVGLRPDPRFLCTPEARRAEVIERAWRRSLGATPVSDDEVGGA